MADLPDIDELRFKCSVYPGQPLVCAAAIVLLFDNLDDAAAPTEHGYCQAEASDSPGAGGQNGKAVQVMKRWREHEDMDTLIEELHDWWGRTVLHQPSYADRYDDGMEKARALEPVLREALATWLTPGEAS